MFALRNIGYQVFHRLSQQQKFFASKADKVFADPTYDNTFKMLCTNSNHPQIIKSILNNFLDLKGDHQITEVSLHTNTRGETTDVGDRAYVSSSSLKNDTRFSVDSTVDFLCTTKNGKQIAIEMQRAHEDYFLSRSQLYMSKLLASQVETGHSSKAHKVMLDTYIICIGKENIIRDKAVLEEQKKHLYQGTNKDLSFELTVTPTIHDLWITIEDNKMTWKFFELKKFKEFIKHVKIDQNSPVKHQWMNFLLKCHEAEETPKDVADIVKEGYEIMKMANWTPIQKVMYDMEIDKEELTLDKIDEATLKGMAAGEVRGEVRGEARGKAKGESISIKKALHYGERDEAILSEHSTITREKLVVIKSLPQPPKLDDITQILLGIDTIEPGENITISGEHDGEDGST